VARADLAPVTISLSPVVIYTLPTSSLWDSSIAPGNVFAKIFHRHVHSHDRDRPTYIPPSAENRVELHFYYPWYNPSDHYAVVNVRCAPIFTGRCVAAADAGFLSGGDVLLHGQTTLFPLLWNEPEPSTGFPHKGLGGLNVGQRKIFEITASGTGFWGLETGDAAIKLLAESIDLGCQSVAIPPQRLAMFWVYITFNWQVQDGYAEVDFAKFPTSSITIPSFELDLWTAPSVDVGPFGSVGATASY
jgi:hypothetical protein